MRFKKSDKILKRNNFKAVYKTGRKVSSKDFFLSWLLGKNQKIGITVSSEVGPAHTRNRIKRVVREIFRLNRQAFPIGDCVVTARKTAGNLVNDEIRTEIAKILSRLK